jgi:hypothetical protein
MAHEARQGPRLAVDGEFRRLVPEVAEGVGDGLDVGLLLFLFFFVLGAAASMFAPGYSSYPSNVL